MKFRSTLIAGSVLLSAAIAVVPARAAEPAADFGAPIDAVALDAQRGGTDLHINQMNLNGTSSDNTATNDVTGGNSISQGAFAGSSGVPMVVQNSGNNVVIQNSTIINVNLK